MTIKRLKVKNFRLHEDNEITFDDSAQLTLLAGSNGAGKCLPGDTRVHDGATGESLPLEQFVRERRTSTLGHAGNQITTVPVTDWLELGVKDTVVVKLSDGTEMRMATTHPVLTDQGCVRAGDLTTDHWVAQAGTLPELSHAPVTPEEAYIIGLMLGDGCLVDTVKFTCADEAVIIEARRCLDVAFPGLALVRSGKSLDYRFASALTKEEKRELRTRLVEKLTEENVPLSAYMRSSNITRLRRGESALDYGTLEQIEDDFGLDLREFKIGLYGSGYIRRWFAERGILGKNADEKYIPADMFFMPEAQTAALLGGLWQSDGWFTKTSASLGSNSRRLVTDIKQLLLRFGALATITPPPRGGAVSKNWRVNISTESTPATAKFVLVGDKAARRQAALDHLATRPQTVSGSTIDRIPQAFNVGLNAQTAKGQRRSKKQMARHAMGREMYEAFGGSREVLDSDLRWFRVTSVAESTPIECFDLTVDTEEHLYLAETWVVHNSSILEAVHYALYAEGRSTKTRLGDMVRGGAELEGMTVELDLLHNGHEYSVTRHYEDGMSHASLSMDGTVVTQGPREVTQYFAQLFGMDARGFDLAVFAHQKQLNGLTSLSASRRAQTVSRLVRADAFTKASHDARSDMNDTKRVLKALGELPDLDELKELAKTRQEEFEAAIAAQNDARQAAQDLEKELNERADVQEQFRQAAAKKARAEGNYTATKEAVAAARKELETARGEMTERPNVPEGDPTELEDELDAITERLTAAQTAARAVKDRASLNEEKKCLEAEQAVLMETVGKFRGNVESTSAVVKAEQALSALRKEREDTLAKLQETHSQEAVVSAQLVDARESLQRLQGLDAVCPVCEQAISDEHRDTQVEEAEERIKKLSAESEELNKVLQELGNTRDELLTQIIQAENSLDEAKARESEVASAESQLEQVERTLAMYKRRIDALPEPGEPVEPLAEKRAELAAQVQARRTAERAMRTWERQDNRRQAAETALSRAELNLEQAKTQFEEAEIPQDLADAVDELGVLATKLAAERDLLSECTTLAAVAEQQSQAAQNKVAEAEEAAERRSKLVANAERSEAAARLLASSARHMTSRIRPALEGAMGSLLAAMTEGRYDAVKIDKDYNIAVHTDSGYRPLAEMSGGEQDLIALALRLGLARIVSATHGASGPGFLVLDEVFGSQDARRRETILEALKSLRNVFPQILLVSHVGGTEDQVDQVVRFEIIEGDEEDDTTASSLVTVE